MCNGMIRYASHAGEHKSPWTVRMFAMACIALLGFNALAEEVAEVGYPTFLSPHASPIVLHQQMVYVTNTPAATVDVLDAASQQVVARINVGIDPVGLALRPDGSELWVSNHVSDSVSVVDINVNSLTYLTVIATVQDINESTGATQFDEPVGIAFANNEKAYVALSSENKIAIVDVASRQVTGHININAQDPRAIRVRDDNLYVIAFESNNQTQLSGCVGSIGGDLCTFDIFQHSVATNNVLSQFVDVDIIKNSQVPDRDLYVYSTANDQPRGVVSGAGTLLYGLAVDSQRRVFIAQTDARNDANGKAGTAGHGLAEMENRAFLNQITRFNCGGLFCSQKAVFELEPLPPNNPSPGQALATPYAIEISDNDNTLVATAAGSDVLFTAHAGTGEVLGRVVVGEVPRGIALAHNANGRATDAWVYNAVDNSVSLVDLSDLTSPQLVATTSLEDPTHPTVKQGRIAFNDANASSTGTFSCESCHPDGGTDQLLWLLDTPICDVPGCTQIPPRITMPIRGLRDTQPYHWDGIPGDPYGGNNTSNIFGISPPNCALDEPESCTRDLIDGGLASTMCQSGVCPPNDEGKPGALSAAERDAMATFLLSVPYPPAQRRAISNELSATARSGFRLFHIDGDLQPQVNVCGDCHRMPFWVTTNTPGTGMEAPTWRGAYDRWLILPQGRLNVIDLDFYRTMANAGAPEQRIWSLSWAQRPRFDPVWNMVTEGSTGFHGAYARQVTLNELSVADSRTDELFEALETAAREGGVVLKGSAVFTGSGSPQAADLVYTNGTYIDLNDNGRSYRRGQLEARANMGTFSGTFTAYSGPNVDVDHPQPGLWTLSPYHLQTGRQDFPTLNGSDNVLTISGRHVQPGARVYLNGRRIAGYVTCDNGELPDCAAEVIKVHLGQLPTSDGTHFLQIQNPGGLFSNDFIFHTQSAPSIAMSQAMAGIWGVGATPPGQPGAGASLQVADIGGIDLLTAVVFGYDDGAPYWAIGTTEVDGSNPLTFDLAIFSGADFPPDFNSQDVIANSAGTASLRFADSTQGLLRINSDLGDSVYPIDKLITLASPTTASGCLSGAYAFQSLPSGQPGHGLLAEVFEVGGTQMLALSWYAFRDGEQVFVIGVAPITNGQATMQANWFHGADADVSTIVSEPFGTLVFMSNGPDSASFSWSSTEQGFSSGTATLERLSYVTGWSCP